MDTLFTPLSRKLRIDDSLYKRLLDSLYDGVYFVDRERRITYWNRAAERLTGYAAEEVVGRSCSDNLLVHVDDAGRQLCLCGCPLWATMADHVPREADVHLRHKRGHRVPVSVRAMPITGDDGEVLGAVEVFHDNSAKREAQRRTEQLQQLMNERERAQEALMRAEKLASAGRVAATLAHEINNPITAVMNLLYMLRGAPLDQESERLVALAEEELRRVANISRTTLGFYRTPSAASPVDVGQLLDEVIALYARKLQENSIAVTTRYAPAPRVTANEGELRQVLSNLVANAIDASADGGRILVRVTRTSGAAGEPGLQITVADTGSGIERAHLPNVFEAFFTTKQAVGTGLGLWASKTIVQKHGGTIRVKSAKGRGTVFRVFLPVAASSVAAAGT